MEIIGYLVDEKLFQGKNVTIYRAKKNGTTVILKTLEKKKISSVKILQSLKNEYHYLNSVDHRHVIKPLELLEDKDYVCLVLEDINGVDLNNLINEGPVPPDKFIHVAVAITSGLSAIHSRNIIHQDINPANVVWNPDTGAVKVIDLNIASKYDIKVTHLGNPEKLHGTIPYISPEQTGRMNRRVDQRTDLYSLGVTFYHMLTGQLPFTQNSPMEIVYAHLARDPEPPRNINKEVPVIFSKLVLKLMAKNPEERYQSANGLKYDLKKLRDMGLAEGKIPDSFILGDKDYSGKLQIPENLYGRQEEITQLGDAYQRVSSKGTNEMILVAGYSGTGKTALVNEIHKPITRDHGHFVSGKYDQLQRTIPYSAIIQTLDQLCEILLAEKQEILDQWKQDILKAVGNLGKVLTDMIPQLEAVIGKQPNVPHVQGEEAKERFHYVIQRFIQVVSTQEHPLVIFIDDLQWADQASLSLLRVLMEDRQNRYLLLIGAYRDNEVSPAHPLMTTIEEIKKQDIAVHTIPVNNLSLENIEEWFGDTLKTAADNENDVSPLAALIHRKTQGNAFFTIKFLENLYRAKLLTFKFKKSIWQWDVAKIEQENITDNVVDLLIDKIRTLPVDVQEILKLSACIGNVFDLKMLGIISQTEKAFHEKHLDIAIAEQLLYPLEHGRYKFIHDRIHQAAYSMIADEAKNPLHLKIGRLLLATVNAEEGGKTAEEAAQFQFEIVNHLNMGIALIDHEAEKLELVQLNLNVGQQAKLSAAYDLGSSYVRTAIGLLPANCNESHYQLTLSVYNEAIQTAYLCADFEEMEKFIEIVLGFADSISDKTTAYEHRIMGHTAQSQEHQSVETLLTIFSSMGVDIPKDADQEQVMATLQQHHALLEEKGIESISDLPQVSDPKIQLVLRLYYIGSAATALASPGLFPMITSTMIDLILKNGITPEVPFILTWYGIVRTKLEDFSNAYTLGRVALDLLDKGVGQAAVKARSIFSACCYLLGFKMHYKETCQLLIDNYPYALNIGDVEYASYYLTTYVQFVADTEMELGEILDKGESLLQQIKKLTKHALIEAMTAVQTAYAASLTGATDNPTQLDLSSLAEVEKNLHESVRLLYTFKVNFKTILLKFLFEDYGDMLDYITAGEKDFKGAALNPTYDQSFYHFIFSLVYIQLYTRSQDEDQKKQYMENVDKSIVHMKALSDFGPANYLHKYYLMVAEKCRITGDEVKAGEYYDKAIETAYENQFNNEAGIANELAAKFYMHLNRQKLATLYFMEALNCYHRWGALAKIKHLEETYPKFINLNSISSTTTGSTSKVDNIGENLDLHTILKASQTLSGEVQLKGLMGKMMQILIENAGAQKSILIENIGENLFIQTEGNTDGVSGVLNSIPVENSDKIPLSVIHYVARSKHKLVFENVSKDLNYSSDPYIQKNQPKSVVCFPILSKSNLATIIYLENNLVEGAFTPARLELLNMLSSQIAISIENTRLYENLEEKVRQRTLDLEKVHKKLEQQHEELTESHKKINDSVNYASKIQQAVLPVEETLNALLPQHFVFYRPCSVVSGDFFWVKQIEQRIVVAAVDCTGHGIPGALLSMLGISFLNEIVPLLADQNKLNASNIMNHLRHKVKTALKQDNTHRIQRDGMDIALCIIDIAGKEIQYAGAHNPFYMISNNKLMEIKADRMPIGISLKERPFTNHIIPIESGSMIYLFTDGYADQNGEDGEVNFTKKRFKKILTEINTEPVDYQKEVLIERFDQWRGDLPQRDDVLVIGIRL